MPKKKQPELEWLVASRSNIQVTALDVLKLLNDANIYCDSKAGAAIQLLVGTVFSLWRAVFLAHGERSEEDIVITAREYLTRVIRDNTITYGDDSTMRKWAFGFYLNNARFRIQEVEKSSPSIKYKEKLKAIGWSDSLTLTVVSRSDSEAGWNLVLKATQVAVAFFKKQLAAM